MPTYQGDFKNGYQFGFGLNGAALAAPTTGTGVAMPIGDGLSSAIINFGVLAGTGTVQIQESETVGGTYTNVDTGLYTYTATEDNSVVALTYQRTKACLRVVATPAAASDIAVSFVETKKTF